MLRVHHNQRELQDNRDTTTNNTVNEHTGEKNQSIRRPGRFSQPATRFQLVFSTGCSPYQNWQSLVLFYHILTAGQTGNVTRVASGCTDQEALDLQLFFKNHIANLSDQFHLHLTPDYKDIMAPDGGPSYNFFNKPMGLKHWLETGLRYEEHREELDDVIFIILDPDEIVLRPFTHEYNNDTVVFHQHGRIHSTVAHGKPMAAWYGLHARYMNKINMTEILGSVEKANQSPATHWDRYDVLHHYAAGPPYIATGRDMFQIVLTWADFVVPVYKQTQNHLSEMFAYSVAALHLSLPHQLMYSFMVSDAKMEQEGWSHIESLENPCANDLDPSTLPYVLHYCQHYGIGPWFFSKYSLPHTFLSCNHPLMLLPNDEEAATIHLDYTYGYTYEGKKENLTDPTVQSKRMAFMICQLTRKVNEAAVYWKQRNCDSLNETTNYQADIVWPSLQKAEVKKVLDKQRERMT
jgi:hypothetical protein